MNIVSLDGYTLYYGQVHDDSLESISWSGWARSQDDAVSLALWEVLSDRDRLENDGYTLFDPETFREYAEYIGYTVSITPVSDTWLDCPRCEGMTTDVGLEWRSCGTCGYRFNGFQDEADTRAAIARDQAIIDQIDDSYAALRNTYMGGDDD